MNESLKIPPQTEEIPDRRPVQLRFQEDFTNLSAERQAAAINAVAGLLGVAPELFRNGPWPDRLRELDALLPDQAVEQLHTLLRTNSGPLRMLGVERVMLQRMSGEMQHWTNTGGRFDLKATSPPADDAFESPNGPLSSFEFEAVPRIWLFHLIYFLVTGVLSLSVVQYSTGVAISLLLMTLACTAGMILAGFKRLLATHILAIAVGLIAPVIVFGRLGPLSTSLLFTGLVAGIFLVRRFIL